MAETPGLGPMRKGAFRQILYHQFSAKGTLPEDTVAASAASGNGRVRWAKAALHEINGLHTAGQTQIDWDRQSNLAVPVHAANRAIVAFVCRDRDVGLS